LLLRLRNDLYCVEWGVKLYSLTHSLTPTFASSQCGAYSLSANLKINCFLDT